MAKNTDNDEIAKKFTCPISGRIMNQPVLCDDGRTYEFEEVTKFLNDNATVVEFLDAAAIEELTESTSSTNFVLKVTAILQPNKLMEASIRKFLSDNPEYQEDQYQVSGKFISGPPDTLIHPQVPVARGITPNKVAKSTLDQGNSVTHFSTLAQKRKTPLPSLLPKNISVKQALEPTKRQKLEMKCACGVRSGIYLPSLDNDNIKTEKPNTDEFYSTHSESGLKFN